MSGRPHAPSLTAEDYYNLPDNGMRYWLIEGELYMAPAPNPYHQTISGNLDMSATRTIRPATRENFSLPIDITEETICILSHEQPFILGFASKKKRCVNHLSQPSQGRPT